MRSRVLCMAAAAALVLAAGCRGPDTQPLDKAGVGYSTIQELRGMKITDDEVTQIVKARESGMRDANLVELVRLVHSHGAPFAQGFAISGLRNAGMSEEGVMQLGRMNLLGPWAGEAQALLFAGFSEDTVLELARRRHAGQPTLSSPSLAKLKNAGTSEAAILMMIREGVTDADVNNQLDRLPSPGGFRKQPPRRRR